MTVIALHAHTDVSWVSWRDRHGFGRIHLERRLATPMTLCGLFVPRYARIVVRNQESAAIEDLCKSCLKEYATHH